MRTVLRATLEVKIRNFYCNLEVKEAGVHSKINHLLFVIVLFSTFAQQDRLE
jgi:hypothetical protein